MAITSFIPQVWSARLQQNLQKSLVFGNLCNRNYEGDIAQWGDTVHINVLNDVTVKPYTPGTELDDPEQLSGTDTVLSINHGAYYNFFLNDVDAAQARADVMDVAMRNAAYQLAVDVLDPPADFIRLCGDIACWAQANADPAVSSEKLGEYSVNRRAVTWETAFAPALNPYRRMFSEVRV